MQRGQFFLTVCFNHRGKNCMKYKDSDLNLSVLMLWLKQTFRQKVWVSKKKSAITGNYCSFKKNIAKSFGCSSVVKKCRDSLLFYSQTMDSRSLYPWSNALDCVAISKRKPKNFLISWTERTIGTKAFQNNSYIP